jgi:hypothetical protein
MKLHKEDNPFTQVPNELLNSANISMKAKGLYAFMASKPNNYHFTILSLAKQLKEGKSLIGSGLQELREHGWITYFKEPNGSSIYTVQWSAAPTGSAKPENPYLGTNSPKAKTRKPACINKIDSFIDKSNNNRSLELYEKLREFYPKGGFSPGEATKQKFLNLDRDQQQLVLYLAEDQLDRGVSVTYSALLIKMVVESPVVHTPFHAKPS